MMAAADSTHCPALHRSDVIANLLEEFFKENTKAVHNQPDGFVLVDEILAFPKFEQGGFTASDIIFAVHADSRCRFSVRGDKIRVKPMHLNCSREVIVSKRLSWILRHGAAISGLSYDEEGFLYLEDIMKLRTFKDVSLEEIKSAVYNNSKMRFEMRPHPVDGRMQLRAVQGHSVTIPSLNLNRIEEPDAYPVVIHGTYFRCWNEIREQGLKRMNRTHIHFAPGEVGKNGVISGMRSSAEVVIYINLALALADGYEFYLSANNVILCPGNSEGVLPPKYFLKAVDRHNGNELPVVS